MIRIAATCVCGSDLWPYRGLRPIDGPTPMGHEYCGVLRRPSQVNYGRPKLGQAGGAEWAVSCGVPPPRFRWRPFLRIDAIGWPFLSRSLCCQDRALPWPYVRIQRRVFGIPRMETSYAFPVVSAACNSFTGQWFEKASLIFKRDQPG